MKTYDPSTVIVTIDGQELKPGVAYREVLKHNGRTLAWIDENNLAWISTHLTDEETAMVRDWCVTYKSRSENSP